MDGIARALIAAWIAVWAGVSLYGPAGLAQDLYDPDEAARYRLRPKALAETILQDATTQPASQPDGQAEADQPTSQPAPPFAVEPPARPDALPGYVELSDGTVLAGLIYTTRERPWSVYQAESKAFRRIPPVVVRRIDALVVWERDEPQWRWKEQGSDEKIYTGQTYPARLLNYRFTLADGQEICGTVHQPIHVQADGRDEPVRLILHERDKGPVGAGLDALVYVKHVRLGKEALAAGRELAARRAARRAGSTQPTDPE